MTYCLSRLFFKVVLSGGSLFGLMFFVLGRASSASAAVTLQRSQWAVVRQQHRLLVVSNRTARIVFYPSFINVRGGATATPGRFNSTVVVPTTTTTTTTTSTVSTPTIRFPYRVYLAVGSNLGDRFQNIHAALHLLCQQQHKHEQGTSEPTMIRLVRTSFLHETAPMYVTDQPAFLNGAVEMETNLEPHDLLRRIKRVEADLGRDLETGLRNGPRPVDLDILLYETRINDDNGKVVCWKSTVLNTPDLQIPHPRIGEREFVLAPLCEVAGRDLLHPVLNETIGDLFRRLQQQHTKSSQQEASAVRVLPLARGRMLCFDTTTVMGILNCTPDSFSDGGQWSSSVERAAHRALEMEEEGAGIIDIGGESTRPGAKEISIEEEIQRTIPVIERIRQGTLFLSDCLMRTARSIPSTLTLVLLPLSCAQTLTFPSLLIRDVRRLRELRLERALIS